MKKTSKSVCEGNAELKIPKHVAFIMDGNGRWAKNRGLPRKMGHIEGVRAMQRITKRCREVGIGAVSIFAFSTENWNRPKEEVDGIMKLIKNYLKQKTKSMVKNNIKFVHSGELKSPVPEDVQKYIREAVEATKNNNGMIYNLCFNYGGRSEIVKVCNELLKSGKKEISFEDFEKNLYTFGLPELDMVVRTSGEQRISNYMLWQMAYSEFYFVKDKHWPDFGASDVDDIIVEYNKRNRRFGAIKE